MKFSEGYSCIIGGAVYSTPLNCSNENHVEREMSVFGEQLVYVNAGVVEKLKMRPDLAGEAISTPDTHAVRALELRRTLVEYWASLRQELESREDVTVRTHAMLAYVWTNAALHRNISYPS